MTEKTTEKKDTQESKNQENSNKEVKLEGKYTSAIGRRKRAVARVRLFQKGKGAILINSQKINAYFPASLVPVVNQPLKVVGRLKDFNISILVNGGGKRGQADAIRHGIARALVKVDRELRIVLKTKGLLTRDARKKERKKPGLKKARRAPQWSKR